MLNMAYKILMDPEKRKIYDETGSVEGIDDELDTSSFNLAYAYYRLMYKAITDEDIDMFEAQYKESEEEEEDVLQFYEKYNGDVTHLLECIPLSNNEDVKRLLQVIDNAIKKGKVKSTSKYNATRKKVKLLLKEENFDEEGIADLRKQIILKKKKSGDDLLERLAAKYGATSDEVADASAKKRTKPKPSREKRKKKE
eukprot:TRINITY_DN2911_c0_g4_i1.p1 TRINITY_DN2911_c0_g4~~TRINITY_DN2911_c0_g4_i1.p1  ORF type:complete len:197 (+),score=69.27 TRINITY_DN2911_c0_g4_i1:180-770(+)